MPWKRNSRPGPKLPERPPIQPQLPYHTNDQELSTARANFNSEKNGFRFRPFSALCGTVGAVISRLMREVGVLLCLVWMAIFARAADPAPASAGATNSPAAELEAALKKLRLVPGFRAQIFAAEPLIQNPVSFAFDEQGRALVVETHRRRTSVFDIRNHPDWLDTDFSFRTNWNLTDCPSGTSAAALSCCLSMRYDSAEKVAE